MARPNNQSQGAWQDVKYTMSSVVIFLLLVVMPPIGLIAMFTNSGWSKGVKLFILAVYIIIFLLFLKMVLNPSN